MKSIIQFIFGGVPTLQELFKNTHSETVYGDAIWKAGLKIIHAFLPKGKMILISFEEIEKIVFEGEKRIL